MLRHHYWNLGTRELIPELQDEHIMQHLHIYTLYICNWYHHHAALRIAAAVHTSKMLLWAPASAKVSSHDHQHNNRCVCIYILHYIHIQRTYKTAYHNTITIKLNYDGDRQKHHNHHYHHYVIGGEEVCLFLVRNACKSLQVHEELMPLRNTSVNGAYMKQWSTSSDRWLVEIRRWSGVDQVVLGSQNECHSGHVRSSGKVRARSWCFSERQSLPGFKLHLHKMSGEPRERDKGRKLQHWQHGLYLQFHWYSTSLLFRSMNEILVFKAHIQASVDHFCPSDCLARPAQVHQPNSLVQDFRLRASELGSWTKSLLHHIRAVRAWACSSLTWIWRWESQHFFLCHFQARYNPVTREITTLLAQTNVLTSLQFLGGLGGRGGRW